MDEGELSLPASQRRSMKREENRKRAAKGTPASHPLPTRAKPSTHPEHTSDGAVGNTKAGRDNDESNEDSDSRSEDDESSPPREDNSTLAEELITTPGVMLSDNAEMVSSLSHGITPAAVMTSSAKVEISSRGGEDSSVLTA